jgi:hypothetical protein
MVISMVTGCITAILTGRMGYDTFGGAFMLLLAAVAWTMDSFLER